jgi:hypothetical protein
MFEGLSDNWCLPIVAPPDVQNIWLEKGQVNL